jgi:hypothetical protein
MIIRQKIYTETFDMHGKSYNLENAENNFFLLFFFLNIPLLSRSLLNFVVPM